MKIRVRIFSFINFVCCKIYPCWWILSEYYASRIKEVVLNFLIFGKNIATLDIFRINHRVKIVRIAFHNQFGLDGFRTLCSSI